MTTNEKIQELTESDLVSSKKIAQNLGLSISGLRKKMKGISKFTELECKEIDRIYNILKQI